MSALADDPNFSILLKEQSVRPSEANIPAGVKAKLSDLTSRKPGQQINVFVGPLDQASHEFFDDLHPQTGSHLVVK